MGRDKINMMSTELLPLDIKVALLFTLIAVNKLPFSPHYIHLAVNKFGKLIA